MNIAEAQEVKHFLLQSHDQYRELAERHHALDDRLHELTERPPPLRIRASRRSHPQEAQAGPQGPHGTNRPRVGARSSSPRHPEATGGAAPRRRSCTSGRRVRDNRVGPRQMRIDPAGWPFVGIGLGVAALVAALAGSAYGIAALLLPAFFLFFFRDPGSPGGLRARRRALAGRRARDGGGRADRELRGRRLAADHHLPVADGRARQPYAGVGPRDVREVLSGTFSPGLPAGCRRPERAHRGQARFTAGCPSSSGRSSASSRAASSAACARVTW